MIDKNRLAEKCSTWNITLTGTQLDQLDQYAELLVSYNQKVNLTAITDPEGIEDKHFLDSLLFACQPEVAGKMVDVGAGAGFPGIVTKIYKPHLDLTLMEPTGKRVDFLRYACETLGLTGVSFAKERAEEAARKSWREQFDLVSARAVAALPVLAEYCLPLAKVGTLPGHEGGLRRRGAGGRPGCHPQAGRQAPGDPGLPSSGRGRPQPGAGGKNFADSDRISQKRRKNCESAPEIRRNISARLERRRTIFLESAALLWYS